MPSKRPLTVKEVFQENYRVAYKGDYYRVFLEKHHNDVFQDFSLAELIQVDSRIPAVLQGMFNSDGITRFAVQTSWVVNTLAYMDNPIELSDIFAGNYLVKEVSGVSMFNDARDEVTISVVHYDYVRLKPLPYVTNIEETYLTVKVTDLDAHFPGWLACYDALVALGYKKTDLVKQTFYNNVPSATAQVTMNQVTFE